MSTNVGKALVNASADDAQLILSLLVWPKECPDPRVVDAWLRRQETGRDGETAGPGTTKTSV